MNEEVHTVNKNEFALVQSDPENRTQKLLAALAAIAGTLGIIAAGGSIAANGIDSLPQIMAMAVPGLVAWVISWLLYQTDDSAEIDETKIAEELSLMLADTDNSSDEGNIDAEPEQSNAIPLAAGI